MSRSKAEVDNFIASFRRKAKNEQEIQLRGYQFATFYWEAREYALAIQWAQSYLAIKNTDSRVHKLLGNLYEAVKDYNKAIDSYKKSLEFNETQKDLILRIASLGCTIPNFDVEKLRYWVERAERFYPSHTNIHKIKENIFRRSGKLPDYEIYLRNKLVQRKGDYYLNCKLVKLLIEMHRLREAVDHILLTQDMESVADQPIWWESTVHTLEIYIKSIRQGEERTTSEDTIMEMHSHLLVALCKWIMLSLAIMDKPPHNAVVLLKGLDQCLLRANSLKVNSNWDCILDEMSSHLYYLMGLHLCRMAAMGSFRWADIIGLVTSCFIHSAQVKLPDMSGRPEYEAKKWTLLASARLSEVSHMLHAFQKQYGPDWLEKCHRSASNLQSQTHLFHVAFGQEADPNKSFFMSDTNFVKIRDIVLDDLVGVVLKYDQDAVLAQPHNLQLLVWLGLQWDVRKDGISPDLGTFIETSFDKLHFASNNLKITSVDNLRLLDIEAFLYILVKAAKAKRQAMLADGRTDPNQPSILPVPLCQMLFTEEQGKWFKSVCALYSGNAKSEERAKMRLSIQKGLEAIRNADKFNIDTPLLIHLARTFRARMLEEKKENDVPDNEQFLACQRLSVHYWQAANEHLKMLASDKAVSPPKHEFFIPSQDKIKKEEIGSLLEEAAVALSEYEFQQGHHQQALNLLSKVKGVTGLFTKALMCKQLSKVEVEGKDDSQITASMILKQGSYLDQCTYALYSAMDAIQDDHNNSMHEEIQGMLDEIDIEKQQLARKGLEESESLNTSHRFSSNTPSRLSLGKTPSRTPQDGRSSLTSIGDISFHQGLSPDPSPRRLMSELRTMNMSQTRLVDENSQLRTLALSHSRLLEQNAEILSKHNDVMDQNRFLMEQIINLNKELQELKLNTPPPAHLSKLEEPKISQSGNDSGVINTVKNIVINADNCRIEHAEASNITAPQPVMYYPTHPPMFPQPLLPGYNLPGLSFSGLPTADPQYMPSMMASTPAPHYHSEDAFQAEGDAYTIDPNLTIPSLKLLDPKGLSTPTHPVPQSRTSENPAESTRIDEGFTGFSGLGTIHPKTFLQTGATAGLSPVAPSGSPGLQSSIYQQKLNMQPMSSPVGASLNKGEPAPEKLASDAPLLRKILIGSEEDPATPQTVPTFPSLSSNSRFGAGDKSSERSAVSPNFTSGTRLGSAKAKEPEPTKGFTPTFSFGNKSETSTNPPVKTTVAFPGFSFGSGNIFTPVSGHQPVPTSSNLFSKPTSVFGEPQPASISQVSHFEPSSGMKGLNFTTPQQSTSPFAGLGLGTQKSSPTTVVPQPVASSLSAGQEATVSSSTSKTKEDDDDDVICVYEKKPTPAQIAMALKLKLPPTFYLYEYKEPCKGCIGCQEDLNLAMLFNKENRISRDIATSVPASSQANETQASKQVASTAPFMFGGSSSSSMTFASLSTSNQSTPDFMKQNSSQNFSWTNAGTQLFSSPAAGGGGGGEDDYDPHYEPIVTLPEITDLKTGEEDETCLWKERAKLYRFNKDVNQWKERGVGDVKFMQNKNTGRVRILMRRDQVLKVCANHMITADLEMKVMQSSDRAWVWSALDFSEGEAKMEQLAIKFKKPEMAKEFKEKFDESKQLVIEADKKGSDKKLDEKSEEPKAESFADKFKPKPGTWTCDTCLVTNPPDTVTCLACATLKPGATPPVASKSSEPVVASGGFKFGGTISSPQTSGFSFGGPTTGANSKPQSSGFSFGGSASTTTDGKPQSTGFSFGKAASSTTDGQTQSSGFTFGKAGGSGAATADNMTSKPTSFTFGQPVVGTQSETSVFAFGNSKPTGTSAFSLDGNSSKASATQQQKTSSAATTSADDNSLSLADRFKPKPGDWSCPTCFCQNSSEHQKCPACQTQQPGVQPEASSMSSTTASRFQFGSSKQEGTTPTSPSKTFSFGTAGKALPQFSFGGGEEKSANSNPSASTGFTFAAKPSSGGFMFGSNLNQNASEEQALDLSSPKKTGSPSCKFSDMAKSFTFQFKMDPEEAANAPPKSPTKSPGIQRSPGFIRSPSLDRSGDDSYCKDDDGDGLHFEPVVQLEPVELTTGEENEEVMFCHRAKMYRFNKETNEWKERGMGDIKILKHKETGLYRLLMRREQVLKLCANHFILPEIVLKPNSGSDRSWVWTAMDASDDGELKSELLAVRFKTADVAVEFKEAFENAKESVKKIKSNGGGEKSAGNMLQEVKGGKIKEGSEDEADKDQEDDEGLGGEEKEEDGARDEGEQDEEEDEEQENEDDEEETEEKGEDGTVKDTPSDAAAPQVTFKFGMDFAAAVRKTMSEDEKNKTPISILKSESSPEKSTSKSTDQGYYPEEERDDLQFKPIVTLAEVEVKTGEEDEEQLFCQRAKMYRWNRAESQWKERGVGEIKILKHKVLNRSRVLMRRDQVLKICANHIITPEMELKPNAGSDRSLVWNAMDASDDEPQPEQLAVRFKTADITAEFKSVFEKCQGS